MAEIAPFRGILYDPKKVDPSRVLAPPYDVISEDDRARLAALDPHNCVRLILPKDDNGGDTDEKYDAAARTLNRWLGEGILRRDEKPSLYRYQQTFSLEGQSATRTGFICRIRLHHFDERIILRHERTLAGPKLDRLNLKRAASAHLSQVFGLYSDPHREVDHVFAKIEQTAPFIAGKTSDNVEQKLWRLEDAAAHAQIASILADKKIYIADGHHRYETMLALRDELHAKHPERPYRSSVDFGTIFLSNLDDPALLVFPTHRVLHSLAGFDRDAVLDRARAFFDVEDGGEVVADDVAMVRQKLAAHGQRGPSFGMLCGKRLAYLTLRANAPLDRIAALAGPSVLRQLDVTVLHAVILESILGVDRSAQEKQTNLRYLKDTRTAIAAGVEPDVQAVFLMNATPVGQVRAVSDAGEVMPQKSTFFYPKLASGLVINPIDPKEVV